MAEYYAALHAAQATAFADRYGMDAVDLPRKGYVVRGDAGKQPAEGTLNSTGHTGRSLPQRFADMPAVEADSSQWFSEGKEIPLPGKSETPEQRKALRNAVKQRAKESFSKDTVIANADTGWQAQVTPKSIEDSLSHGFMEDLRQFAGDRAAQIANRRMTVFFHQCLKESGMDWKKNEDDARFVDELQAEYEERILNKEFRGAQDQKSWIFEKMARRVQPGLMWDSTYTAREARGRTDVVLAVPAWERAAIERALHQRGIPVTEDAVQSMYNAARRGR